MLTHNGLLERGALQGAARCRARSWSSVLTLA
jgi:hypothetical protein